MRPPLTRAAFGTPYLVLDAARYEDQSALLTLLSNAIPACSPETVWQLPWGWTSYLVLRDIHGAIVAAGSTQQIDGQMLDGQILDGGRVELRGIVVHPAHRGQGLASRIVSTLLRRAEQRNHDVVCVTRAPDFFSRFGFVETPLDWLPPPRRKPDDPDAHLRVGMVRRRPIARSSYPPARSSHP